MAFNNNEIFDFNLQETPYRMDYRESQRMTVSFRLSSAEYIPSVQRSLEAVLEDLDLEEKGNEITVSAYPPDNFGEDNVLAIVKKHDRKALKIKNRGSS